MKYQMLVTDLDGTFLDSRGQISEANARAVTELKARGFRFTFATGRIEATARRFVEQLPPNTPLIVCNGARIVEPETSQTAFDGELRPLFPARGKAGTPNPYAGVSRGPAVPDRPSTGFRVLWEHPIPVEVTVRALEIGAAFDLSVNVYQGNHLYVSRAPESYLEWLQRDRVPHTAVSSFQALARLVAAQAQSCGGPLRLAFVGAPEQLAALRARWMEAAGAAHHAGPYAATIVSSARTYLEFLAAGVSKGTALGVLANLLGIPLSSVIAMGDQENDQAMIKAAGLGIAVKNAAPAARDAAQWIAASNDEDAAAQVIERFFLNPSPAVQPA